MKSAACSLCHLCDATVVDILQLQRYLHAKNVKRYAKSMTFSEFNPWRKSVYHC